VGGDKWWLPLTCLATRSEYSWVDGHRVWSSRDGVDVGKRTWLGVGQVSCRLGVGIICKTSLKNEVI
jgi:hypothetical protein